MKRRSRMHSNTLQLSQIKNRTEDSPSKPVINISQTKSEILFNHKSFLEILLGLIKRTQVDYLTNIKIKESNDDTKKNMSKIKSILTDLKESLTEIKKEKEKKIELFQNQKIQKEKNLKKTIFNTVYSKRSVSNFNYINTNFETLITENNENYFNEETPELKLLNFKVENEIIKVDNLIKRNSFRIQYYKTPHLITEHRTEILCDDKRINESMETLLHYQLMQQRKKFIEVVNLKNLQEIRINSIQSQAINYRNAMKEIHKSYKYVNTQEIITEENKSYLETVNDVEKKEEEKANNPDIENNISKSDNNINNINNKNLKLINVNDVEKLLKLNMNINVNINYNQQYINNHFDNSNNSNNKQENEEEVEEKSSAYSKDQNIDNDSDSHENNESNNVNNANASNH